MKVEIEIPEENIRNMLLSAGRWCHYWCTSDFHLVEGLESNGVRLSILPELLEEEDLSELVLNREALARGMVLCAKQAQGAFAALLENNSDGPTSDVLVQFALFGKLRFG